jgi:imidazolonepropionase-like amidohydrolase
VPQLRNLSRRNAAIVSLAGFFLGTLLLRTATAQAPQVFAFVDVHVVAMDSDAILQNQTVVVTSGRITSIAPAGTATVPEVAAVIPGEGRYLMPGLSEMHGHVPGNSDPQYLNDVLFLYVANGVTTVRGMQGQPGHLELREKLATHEVLGPRFITSGPALRGDALDSPDDARQLVLEQSREGYDFVKLLRGLSIAEFDAAVEAGAEVGMALAGHVSEDVGVARALEAGQATIDHLDGYIQYLLPADVDISASDAGFYGVNLLDLVDEGRLRQAAIDTRESGVWIVPTQALIEHIATPSPTARGRAALPEMAYMPPDIVDGWVASKERIRGTIKTIPRGASRLQELRRRLIKMMHDEGVKLLLGSDAPQIFSVPGFSLHQELALIVDAGLTTYEALRTGTVAAAEFFDMENEFGRIREGLAADLILVAANPLQDASAASQPDGVMVRGVWLDRDRLDRGLAAIAERHAPDDTQ